MLIKKWGRRCLDIGLSSAVFYPEVNTENAISVISKLGFKSAEIFLNSPSEYTEDFINRLAYEKEKYNMDINSVHAFSSSFEPYLFDSYRRRRDDMFNYFKQVCKAGKMLGAKCYTFHGMKYQNINHINKQLIIDIYNKLTYTALENGIKLAQENVSWCMSSNIEYIKFIEENCAYDLYFTLDIKQAYRAKIDPCEYIKIMGNKLVNFHINDRDDESSCLLPGKGNVDYVRILKKLKEVGYFGNLIIEVYRENFQSYNELNYTKKKLEKFLQ